MSQPMSDQERKERLDEKIAITKSGYGGIMPGSGNIVDRRDYPEAIAFEFNSLMGNPVPGKLEDKHLIGAIYRLLPDYWAVWKNRFGNWSIGEVGDVMQKNTVQSSAAKTGTLSELYRFANTKFSKP